MQGTKLEHSGLGDLEQTHFGESSPAVVSPGYCSRVEKRQAPSACGIG